MFPRELAYLAKESSVKRIEREHKTNAALKERSKFLAQELATKITDLQLTIPMKVSESSKLYGSITNQLISTHLATAGYDIDKHNIILEEPIRTLGIFDVKIKLHHEVSANIKVWVIAEQEENKE
ncbi:50S ribosomal protein L9 [bioreactor metagenome]|uniref:50S ribosomal protein L9 n=1 Tax=bioreactor metagenome TaxID=1076179 RepID=A0A645HV94_9ZZZZ